MLKVQAAVGIVACLLSTLTAAPPVHQPDLGALKLVRRVSQKYSAARQYVLEGSLDVTEQQGEDPRQILATARVKLGVAPGGKFRLDISGADDKSSYSLISDGHTTWTYVPALKQYTKQDGAFDREAQAGGLLEDKAHIVRHLSWQIVPLLAKLDTTTGSAFVRGPVLIAAPKKDAQKDRPLVYLTLDSSTLSLSNMTWIQGAISNGRNVLVRANMRFSTLRTGNQIPNSEFTFTPPEGAALVDSVQTPTPAASN